VNVANVTTSSTATERARFFNSVSVIACLPAT
jgi:hypothetical protein